MVSHVIPMLVICPSIRVLALSFRMRANPVKVDVPVISLYRADEIVHRFPPWMFSASAIHEICYPFAVSVHGHDSGVGGEGPSNMVSNIARNNKGESL